MYFCLIFEAQKGRFDLRLGIFYHNLRFTNLWHLWKLTRNLLNKWSCDLMYNLCPLIFLFSNAFKYLALSIPDEGYYRNVSCIQNLTSTGFFCCKFYFCYPWITIFLHWRAFKFENLTIKSGKMSQSTGSRRRICFSYDQDMKNIISC